MTAIMVYKKGKHIMLGADGTSLCDDIFKMHHDPDNTISRKITKVKGSSECYLALTGSVKGIDYIRGTDNLLDGRNQIGFQYMVNIFITRLFEMEEKANLLTKKDNKKLLDCSGILITKSHIYNFYPGGYVQEVDDVAFRGSGDSQLFIAYQAYKDKYDGLDLMRKCFSETIKNHGDIGCPVYIVDNQDNQYFYANEEELNKGL